MAAVTEPRPAPEPLPPSDLGSGSVSAAGEPNDRLFQRAALGWVVAPTLILLASCLLEAGEQRQVVVPWFGLALPETCALYSRFGIDCPGCGLTRSFIHIAHMDPLAAWQLHPLSWPLFAFMVAQIPLALAHARGIRSERLQQFTRVNEWALVVLAIALIVLWLGRLGVGFFG